MTVCDFPHHSVQLLQSWHHAVVLNVSAILQNYDIQLKFLTFYLTVVS